MKFLRKRKPDKTEWHLWYAWFPVRAGNYTVWLEYVDRHWQSTMIGGFWNYRPLFNQALENFNE